MNSLRHYVGTYGQDFINFAAVAQYTSGPISLALPVAAIAIAAKIRILPPILTSIALTSATIYLKGSSPLNIALFTISVGCLGYTISKVVAKENEINALPSKISEKINELSLLIEKEKSLNPQLPVDKRSKKQWYAILTPYIDKMDDEIHSAEIVALSAIQNQFKASLYREVFNILGSAPYHDGSKSTVYPLLDEVLQLIASLPSDRLFISVTN